MSGLASQTSSAAEGDFRQRLYDAFDLDLTPNAVITARPFFSHIEVWPDIVIPDLRVVVEYDTIGHFGLEHITRRQESAEKTVFCVRSAARSFVFGAESCCRSARTTSSRPGYPVLSWVV